ncbi:hypothetical protein EG856_02625 [Mycoplasmopsis phocirhinis]|uniref:Uncharacterized protein n=1 Tax=Mycoplasmopsis phocirhinis TaxID=142650 RepID=A0A4P6MTT7_9BACT|nr:hypothetical protein [Mycoplasmopsis phocirhinis]QBF34797.1 hypothetical protein EG856_02625 [Mycoplasmopsis phocirhinis]
MKKKYTLEQKIDTWEKVIDKNAEHFKSRTMLSIQSSTLLVLIIGFLIGIISYALIRAKDVQPSANRVWGLVLLIVIFIVSLWWFIVNVLFISILSKVIKGTNVSELRPLIKIWLRLSFKGYPNRYLLPINDNEFKEQVEKISKTNLDKNEDIKE